MERLAPFPFEPADAMLLQFLKRGAINKYVEAEILNHSKLRHPHVIQFKVGLYCHVEYGLRRLG